MTSITFETREVSPELASEWLTRNTSNRPIREPRVSILARDMRAGRWEMTAETIKFNGDGTLLDGQHRLTAVVRSGCTVPMAVATNVPHKAQSVMDTGGRRSAADALSIAGEKNASLTAAAIRLAIAYERGFFESGSGTSTSTPEVTHAEVGDFLARNPDMRPAAEHARKHSRRVDANPSIVAFTTWRLARINSEQAYKFWEDAAERVGLDRGDPVIAMTDRFAEVRRSRERWTNHMWISAVFRTWNYRREHKPMHLLKIRNGKGGFIPIPTPR